MLNDNALAEFYANALRTQVTDPTVPSWVRQMELLLRADLGETADARAILGGLIAAGQIHSSAELKFLESRLSPEPSPPTVAPKPPSAIEGTDVMETYRRLLRRGLLKSVSPVWNM